MEKDDIKGFDVVSIAWAMQDYADEIRENAEEGEARCIAEGWAKGWTEGWAKGRAKVRLLAEEKIRSLNLSEAETDYLLKTLLG